ncbi:MAG: hypothetical protein QM535_00015 [Limnohabitans sp.]|nr:hypothetical protein [Limnohabitans sp.]
MDYPLKITCDFTIIDKKTISNTTDNTFIDSSYYYEIILINSEYRLKKKIQVDCQTYKKAKQNQIIKLKYYDVINKLIEASLNDERILNAKISVSPLRAMTYTLKRILESPSKKINKMKTKSKLLIIFLNLLVISCKGKIEPIGEKPLDLEGFDFTTKIDLLLPNKNISKEYIGVYEIKSKFRKNIIEKDTTFLDEFGDNKKAIGIEYRQNSSTSIDTLATYDKQVFSKINIATTLKNEIYVMSAVTSEITNTQINSFIEKLSETYGKYVKEEAEFGNNKFYIYEWQANDRIIKFSTIYNNESNTLKIEVSPNSLKVADKEPHYVGYFYVIKKENERMIKNLSTGDFAFIKP